MGASFAALGDLNQPVGGVDEVCARLGAGELETRYVVDQVRRLGPGVIAVFDHARFDVHEVTRELRGHAITAVYLRADPALCAERREQRGGNPRPITWYRGAGAREQAVAHTVGAPVIVDAAQPPASVAYQVRARV